MSRRASLVASSRRRRRASRSAGPKKDLWLLLAEISLGFAMLDGFGGAFRLFALTPLKYVMLQAPLVVASLLLCPRGALRRVNLPLPALALLTWWAASYLWATYRAGWTSNTLRDMTTLAAVLITSQLVGSEAMVRLLIRVGFISIGLIFVALVVVPGEAYVTSGPIPGLSGGFIHKNVMAPCIILTALAVLCFDDRRLLRRGLVALVVLLLFAGQTTTGLATFAVVLLLERVLVRHDRIARGLGRPARVLLFGVAGAVVVVGSQVFASIVQLSGKDLTFSSRTLIWEGVTDAISQRPWQGYGIGVWGNLWVEPIVSINQNNGFLVAESHNGALEIMLQLGIIGLALWALLFVDMMVAGWRSMRRGEPFGRLVLLFGAVVLIVGFSEALVSGGIWLALTITFGALARRASSAEVVEERLPQVVVRRRRLGQRSYAR